MKPQNSSHTGYIAFYALAIVAVCGLVLLGFLQSTANERIGIGAMAHKRSFFLESRAFEAVVRDELYSRYETGATDAQLANSSTRLSILARMNLLADFIRAGTRRDISTDASKITSGQQAANNNKASTAHDIIKWDTASYSATSAEIPDSARPITVSMDAPWTSRTVNGLGLNVAAGEKKASVESSRFFPNAGWGAALSATDLKAISNIERMGGDIWTLSKSGTIYSPASWQQTFSVIRTTDAGDTRTMRCVGRLFAVPLTNFSVIPYALQERGTLAPSGNDLRLTMASYVSFSDQAAVLNGTTSASTTQQILCVARPSSETSNTVASIRTTDGLTAFHPFGERQRVSLAWRGFEWWWSQGIRYVASAASANEKFGFFDFKKEFNRFSVVEEIKRQKDEGKADADIKITFAPGIEFYPRRSIPELYVRTSELLTTYLYINDLDGKNALGANTRCKVILSAGAKDRSTVIVVAGSTTTAGKTMVTLNGTWNSSAPPFVTLSNCELRDSNTTFYGALWLDSCVGVNSGTLAVAGSYAFCANNPPTGLRVRIADAPAATRNKLAAISPVQFVVGTYVEN